MTITVPVDGDPLDVLWGEAITNAINNLTGPWLTWNPVWGSFGTAPNVGNGSLIGKYIRADKLVVFTAELIIGSATTFGTSLYTMSTPTNVAIGTLCAAFLEDNSTGFRYRGTATIDTPVNMNRIMFGDGTTGWTQGTPITLATSDVVRIAGIYQAP